MATAALQKRNYAKSIRTYVMLMVVAAMAAGYYGYTQYMKLSGAQDALAKEQVQITALQTTETETSNDYANLKKDFDQKYSGVLDSLNAVYPLEEDYTKLAISMDTFFQANNTSSNPVFLSDLKFGQARIDATKDYSVLPVSMTITGTQDNFMKFLKYVENSGGLQDKTRLMDVRSISINLSGGASAQGSTAAQAASASTQPMNNVSLSLNAYFQKPFLKTTTAAVTPTIISS